VFSSRPRLPFVASAAALAAALALPARAQISAVDWANLQEDVRGQNQRLGELSLRIELLEHENAKLRAQARTQPVDAVTVAQLNTAVADLNTAIHSAIATSKTEILEQVGTQMEKLARQTNAALDSLAKAEGANPAPRSPGPARAAIAPVATPAADTPADSPRSKGQASYTVQKGDSIDQIARKTGARAQDIIAANNLTDPSRIRIGQTLVIPGGK